MALNIAGTGAADRRRLEEIVQIQTPLPVAAKPANSKPPKAETAPVKPVEFLTKSEKKLVLDKFKPMPPVLERALRGVEVVRQGFQEIKRLTVSPEKPALPAAVNGPGERTGNPLRLQNTAPAPIGSIVIGEPLAKTGANQQAPIQNPDQPPLASTASRSKNIPAAMPQEEVFKTNQPQIAPAERGPTSADRETVGMAKPAQTLIRANLEGPRPGIPFVSVEPQGQTGIPQPDEKQATNVSRNVAVSAPVAQESATRPAGKTTFTETPTTALPVADLIKSEVIEKEIIPPASFMVPVPTVPSTRSAQVGDASVAQSKILNGLPMVIPVSHPTTRNFWDQNKDNIVRVLLEQMRKGGTADMAAEARRAMQIIQVQPLTNPLVTDQAQANQLLAPLTGTNNIRLQELTGLNVLAIETVARTSPSDDNMPRVRAGEELNPPGAKPDNNIGPFGTPPDDDRNNTPPLANLRPPEVPLPTNMRSRLVMVQTVNLVDTVL